MAEKASEAGAPPQTPRELLIVGVDVVPQHHRWPRVLRRWAAKHAT
jgi:hypothetical protein